MWNDSTGGKVKCGPGNTHKLIEDETLFHLFPI